MLKEEPRGKRRKMPRTKSEQAKASRRKGKRGERLLAKRLETWWGAPFHRTPASGALRWGERVEVRGDIVCEDTDFPFVIEEKNREAWEFAPFIEGKGAIFKWWQQVLKDSKAIHRIPLLFINKNRSPSYVIFRPRDVRLFWDTKPNCFITTCNSNAGTLRMVERETFLSCISPTLCVDKIA